MAKTIFDIVNEKQSQIKKKTEFSRENIVRDLDSLIEKYEEVKSDYDVLIDKCNKFLQDGKTFEDFKKEHQNDLKKVFEHLETREDELYFSLSQKPFEDMDFVNLYEKIQNKVECCKNVKKSFLNNDFEATINNLRNANLLNTTAGFQTSFVKINRFLSDKNSMPVVTSTRDIVYDVFDLDKLKKKLIEHFGDKKEINTPEPKSKSLKSFFTKTKENTSEVSMS
jgi:hypothetical protein